MFRRKEESLFDTATDATYTANTSGESGNASTSSTTSTTANNNSSGGNASPSSSTATGSTSSTPVAATTSTTPSRPDTRPASSQTSNNFRPNASSNDAPRSRISESKPVTTTAPVADKNGKTGGRRVLTVGNDILLKGEIATCDRLVIEGKVDATLNDVHTVEISENGSFKGSAQIEDAEISGLFEGDLIVRNRLVIYATGKVRGKITYGEIEIERGGELTGEIKTVGANQAGSRVTRPATATQKEAVAA